MKIHQLRDVIAVADKGSLRAASRYLNVSQSAMTKSIQSLEKELGVPLFERQKLGSALTAMGMLFVQRARLAMNEMNRAREEIEQHLGQGTGRIVVAFSTVPHMALLPEVLEPFLQRYPQIALSVTEALSYPSVEADLRDSRIDFYVGRRPFEALSPGFHMEKLFDNERVIVARNGHPLADARSLADLSDARWVMSDTTVSVAALAALFEKHGIEAPRNCTFGSNAMAQMVMVLNADMLTVVPRQWLTFAALKNLITRVPVKEPIPHSTIVLIRRTSLPLTPAADYFCDLLRRTASRMPGPTTALHPPRNGT